jgi:cytochrome c553
MCHQNGTTYTTAFTSTNIGPTGTQRTSTDTTFATNPNAPAAGFSLYRFSQGHGSTECSACHGSQHAEYPTNQPNDQVYSTNLQGYAGRLTECTTCHGTTLATTNNGGPHGMHTVGSAWVSAHPNYASSGRYTACAYCHGSDYRGTTLSQLLTSKTLNGRTFAAGHQMNCYDCHNGPNGD